MEALFLCEHVMNAVLLLKGQQSLIYISVHILHKSISHAAMQAASSEY